MKIRPVKQNLTSRSCNPFNYTLTLGPGSVPNHEHSKRRQWMGCRGLSSGRWWLLKARAAKRVTSPSHDRVRAPLALQADAQDARIMLLVRPSCRGLLRSRAHSFARLNSTATPTQDNKAYSKTLLLPKTSFPLWIEPAKSEVPFRERTCDALYREQVRSTYGGVELQLTPSKWENAPGPLYVLHDGPPYANGHLHMGIEAHTVLMRNSEQLQAMHSTRS